MGDARLAVDGPQLAKQFAGVAEREEQLVSGVVDPEDLGTARQQQHNAAIGPALDDQRCAAREAPADPDPLQRGELLVTQQVGERPRGGLEQPPALLAARGRR